jgi:3-hydroxyisobutyrate dehydrogenase
MKLGFIGLGNMGRPMATNLLKGGHTLTVHDKREETAEELRAKGAKWADSPKAVAAASKITFSSLPGPKEVEAVALGENGVLQGAAKGSYYVDMSTSTPSVIRKVADLAAAKGVEVLDAPVSGGHKKSVAGTLSIIVGGSERAFNFLEPVLKAMGETVSLVGEVGTGSVVKLVNNMMALTNVVVAMEGMVMGVKAGMDTKTLFNVIMKSSGSSAGMKSNFPNRIRAGKFDPPSFALALACKDMRLAIDYGLELGVPLKVTKLASDLLNQTMQQGLGNQDIGVHITLLEKATGVEVRAKDII